MSALSSVSDYVEQQPDVRGQGTMSDRALAKAGLAALHRVGNQFSSSPLPEWQTFARSTRVLRYRRRDVIDAQPYNYFLLLRGTVRASYEEDGLEGAAAQFFSPGSIFAPTLVPSWAGKQLSPFSVARWIGPGKLIPRFSASALEDCTVLRMDYRVQQQLSARYSEWGQVEVAFLWAYIETVHATAFETRHKDPTERYQKLMERRVFREVLTQRDIASYLGITESALSRIIKRLGAAD